MPWSPWVLLRSHCLSPEMVCSQDEKLCALLDDGLLRTSLSEAFKSTDRRFLQHATKKNLRDGSTACVCIVQVLVQGLDQSRPED